MTNLFTRPKVAVCGRYILLLVGMAGLAGCASEAKPVTAESSKFRPADAAEPPAVATEQPAVALVPDPANVLPQSQRTTAASAKPDVAQTKTAPAPTKFTPGKADPNNAKAPGGNIEQLLATIDRLAQQQPKGATRDEQLEDFVRTQQQRMAGCKQVLALNPDKATKHKVIQSMYQIHQVMGRLQVPGAKGQLLEFARTLAADADPEIAQMGRFVQFDSKLAQIAQQPVADGKEILTEVQSLLDGEKEGLSQQALELAGQAAEALMQNGLANDAAAVLELIAARAAADPKLADQADRYSGRAKLVKADLGKLLTDLLSDQQDAGPKLVAAVKTLLAEVKPSAELYGNLQQVTMILEHTGQLAAAKECFDLVAAAFKDASDPALREAAERAVASARKRMDLVGQPFVVEGLTLDGRTFDWSAYQGKVVLIDFWATWCGPCLEEFPNIRRNFEQFHTLGFDVVGVNLNTNLRDVKEFFSVQDLPWASVTSQVVVDGQAGEDWTSLPMAAKCGVESIPFLVLVGKDGKVDSLHVRGPKLRTRLAQLLGEPPAAAVPADPTAPPPTSAQPPQGKKTGAAMPRGTISPVSLLIAQALWTAPPTEQLPVADDPAINPYHAKPGLAPSELIAYIQKLLDRPKTIQERPGFAEAIVEACDRILAADPPAKEAEVLTAVETKFSMLHREAAGGKEAADKQLMAFVEQMQNDSRPQIANEVKFFKLERRVIETSDAPVEQVPAVLAELQEYLAKEKLSARHLRLASSTVALINRLDNGDEREKHFAQFGPLFAKSSDKELARYGKKLAKKPEIKVLAK